MKKALFFISFISISFCFFVFPSSISRAEIFPDNSKNIPYCAGGECGLEKGIKKAEGQVNDIYKGSQGASYHVQDIINYLLGFLFLLAVIIIIYAGFTILTAAGDEEKVTKSKKMIFFTVIGMAVIYLAGPITRFILDMFARSA